MCFWESGSKSVTGHQCKVVDDFILIHPGHLSIIAESLTMKFGRSDNFVHCRAGTNRVQDITDQKERILLLLARKARCYPKLFPATSPINLIIMAKSLILFYMDKNVVDTRGLR